MSDTPIPLAQAIESFFEFLIPEGLAPSTLRNKRGALDFLVAAAPYRADTFVQMLTQEHFVQAMRISAEPGTPEENARRKAMGRAPKKSRCAQQQKFDRATLRQFAEYLTVRGWQPSHFNPLPRLTKGMKAGGNDPVKPKRPFLPEEQWNRLLDAAERRHPVNRMVIAVGLYLGRRVSEHVLMQWKNIDVKEGEATYVNVKRGKMGKTFFDDRFVAEYIKYRTWFEGMYGPIQPDWYLIPAKYLSQEPWPMIEYAYLDENNEPQTRMLDKSAAQSRIKTDPSLWPVKPTKKSDVKTLQETVQKACRDLGWESEGATIHWLRNSCAESLHRVEKSGRAAQIVLGHDSLSTTLKAYSSLNHQAAMVKEMMQQGKFKAGTNPEPGSEPAPSEPPAIKQTSDQSTVDQSASGQPRGATIIDLASRRKKVS